ncbi:MAG TPA: hypothetical protein VGM10_33930 [Actinocrinis sp.]|jgi:hypothetical protein
MGAGRPVQADRSVHTGGSVAVRRAGSRSARRPAALGAVGVAGLVAVSCLLAGCSGGTAPAADSTPHASPTAPKTYTAAEGPTEAASQLPASCNQIVSENTLSTAFGTTLSTDDSYGSYAPLPSIGRTGRVTCGFGIGIDQNGNQTAAAVTVSVATYDTEADAVARAQDTVGSDLAAGATSSQVLVSGHPATIVVEADGQATASATPAPISSSTFIPLPGTSASAAAGPSASSGSAETELVMADGNRTFVVEIPFTQVSGSAAVTIIEQLTAAIYSNTLPGAGSASASAAG